ncbi:MAG: MFS transporter [Armatimonadetes bacterium]|nr:MFS transporter [Armatimonadota bacterium]
MDRNVWGMGLVSFFTDFSTEMIYPLLPVFLTGTLHASVRFLGAVEGIAESTASLLKLFSGWLSDRLGCRKPIVLAGYTLSSLSKPLVAAAFAPWHVLLIRFADRTGKGIRTAPRDALIADSVGKEERGKAFGLQRTMDHAGAIAGPLVASGLLVALNGNYRLVFALSIIPALLCLAVLAFFVREIPPRGDRKEPPKLTLKPFDSRFKVYLLIVFLFTLGNSSDAFVLLRAREMGIVTALIPIIWVALHIVKMITSMPAGILSDRIGRRGLIITGWAVYALVYAGFAVGNAPLHAWALFLLYGLYFGCTEGVEKAFVADLVPAEIQGTAYGVFNFAIGIGALPASLLMGWLWQRAGHAAAFGAGAALALAASLLMALLVRE